MSKFIEYKNKLDKMAFNNPFEATTDKTSIDAQGMISRRTSFVINIGMSDMHPRLPQISLPDIEIVFGCLDAYFDDIYPDLKTMGFFNKVQELETKTVGSKIVNILILIYSKARYIRNALTHHSYTLSENIYTFEDKKNNEYRYTTEEIFSCLDLIKYLLDNLHKSKLGSHEELFVYSVLLNTFKMTNEEIKPYLQYKNYLVQIDIKNRHATHVTSAKNITTQDKVSDFCELVPAKSLCPEDTTGKSTILRDHIFNINNQEVYVLRELLWEYPNLKFSDIL